MNNKEKPKYRYSYSDTVITAGMIALIDRFRRQLGTETAYNRDGNASEEALVKYTRRLTSATWVIATAAILSFGAALLQWHVLGTTDEKLGQQLTVLEANQQPWMKVETVEAYSNPLNSVFYGLRFSGPKGPAFLPLHIMLKNVGQTPAFDVRASIGELFDGKIDPKELKERERKNCDALDSAFPPVPLLVDNTTFIRAIFPNDEAPYNSLALALTPEEIAKYSDPHGVNKTFQLWFYGCIRYTFASASEPHQTSFAYRVSHIVDAGIPGGKAQDASFKPFEDIPADRILIEARPLAASITN